MPLELMHDARARRSPAGGLLAALLVAFVGTAVAQAEPAAAASAPKWVLRGLPGPHHHTLQALAGRWQVEMGVYGVAGRDPAAKPLTSRAMTTVREWIGDGRYLQDTTEGEVGDQRYWRRGWLGYSTMDQAYEWVTVDATNANMMIYASARMPVPAERIVLTGTFTDQGITGEANAGRRLPMRTEIRIESPDRHVIELYFTPPEGQETLATRQTYQRVKP